MWNTKWLTLSTLAGLIVAVAFATSIPMYADGSLKRIISQQITDSDSSFPVGTLMMKVQGVSVNEETKKGIENINNFIETDIPNRLAFPYETFFTQYVFQGSQIAVIDSSQMDASLSRTLIVNMRSGLQEKNELVNGKWNSDKLSSEGAIEVVMLEEAMFRNDMHVGDLFYYRVGSKKIMMKLVGAINPLDYYDHYWALGVESYYNTLFISEALMKSELIEKNSMPITNISWMYVFDLSNIQTSDISPLMSKLNRLDIDLYQFLKNTRVEVSFVKDLAEFRKQGNQLQTTLFTLAIPMLAMVFYFIMMNAKQALDKQRNDIAVLRSRGASTKQIVFMYVLESCMLGIIALIIGPLIGFFMAKSIGTADGFLSFVNRKAITIDITLTTVLAALVAIIIAMLATVIPAIQYARSSIVSYKQNLARSDKRPFWQKWYLDIVLVLISGYGWLLFNERSDLAMQTGLSAGEMQLQPFLFFVPALTIFSLGLVCLRLFPLMLKLIHLIFKKYMSVAIHLTLVQLTRSIKGYYPLMILLILTIGLGMYNASAARTIDMNDTERTLYRFGADVTIQTAWDGIAEKQPTQNGGGNGGGSGGGSGGGNGGGSGGGTGGGSGGGTGGGPGGGGGNPNQPTAPTKILYTEPPFETYKEAPGVIAATRVLETKQNIIISGKSIGQGTVMGIDNKAFSEVAWFGDNLLPIHQAYYLSYLGYFEQGAIIPQNVAEKYKLEVGDSVTAQFSEGQIEFFIVGIVPMWPSLYPDDAPFIVANLDYIYDQHPLIPYEVWLKVEDDAYLTPIRDFLAESNLQVVSMNDVRNELVVMSKLPTRGGVFGILSLGFIVTILITLAGYLLYWFFNLSGRVVQFGILRAMGLTKRELTIMLLVEQLCTAGLAILLGFIIGNITSRLFLPFLQSSEEVTKQLPPYRVVFEARDTIQLIIVVGVMMTIGATILMLHIKRLKVHQAVKMGEER